MDWLDTLLQLLCQMYREWAGNCKDLFDNPGGAPARVVQEYANKGAPSFPDLAARDKYLETIDELEKHLAVSANTLPPADTEALTGLISDLRSDIGAPA